MAYRHRILIGVGVVAAGLAAALTLIAAGGGASLAQGDIIYVDADATGGANNGSSWADACTTLQPALAAAASGDEIWVAAGTYKPTDGTDRTISFQMKNGVAIYGGFDPTVGDDEREERDWVNNVTILSGDLAGDDGPDFANNEENSYHVFHHPDGTNLDGTAILDGFVISGGNANGDWPHVDGGGMLNFEDSSPTLANCTFEGNSALDWGGGMHNLGYGSPSLTGCTFAGNSARYGGGMHNYLSSPSLTGCTFEDNTALYDGGGMFNYGFSSPSLTGCTFEDNTAQGEGGGMFNEVSSPTLTNCTFAANHAGFDGGGMHNYHASPTLTNCTFAGNEARKGGGMHNFDQSSPTLTNCTFEGNGASYSGGGMNNDGSSPTLTNCTFKGNEAYEWGGGMNNDDASSPTLTNCTFAGNWAFTGGGMYNYMGSAPTLTNCTFAGNSALYDGGGMYNDGSSPTLTNCILWADSPNEVAGSTPVVTYSDVQGGHSGTGNINADPLFVDPGSEDYHLAPGSPCIDAGSNTAPYLPDHDFEGDARIVDGDRDGVAVVDMGVDEALLRVYLPVVVRNW